MRFSPLDILEWMGRGAAFGVELADAAIPANILGLKILTYSI